MRALLLCSCILAAGNALIPHVPKSILSISTKKVAQSVASILALTIASTTHHNPSFAANSEVIFLDSLANIIETKEILRPVVGYVNNQAYDNARTNIKYCLNQLRLQKNLDSVVQNSIDFSDDPDAIEAAADASTRIANTATQLDSTVYTLIFIPSEDGIPPPSAEKYVKQINTFYRALDDDLNIMLKVANEKQLGDAGGIAKKQLKEAPEFLFKQVTKKTTISS